MRAALICRPMILERWRCGASNRMRSRIGSSTIPRDLRRNDLQDRGARVRLLEGDGYKVYRSLRFHPLAIEARCQEIRMRHDIGDADRLFRREREMTIEQRVELHISVAIKLAEAGSVPKCSWISIESPAESLDRMVAAHPPTKYEICSSARCAAQDRPPRRRSRPTRDENRFAWRIVIGRTTQSACGPRLRARSRSGDWRRRRAGQSPPSTRRKRCNEMLEYRTSSLRNVNRRMRLGRFRQRLG